MNLPPSVLHYGELINPPNPERGTIQRWNTPGYRHCQETGSKGDTKIWISREPSWDWIETTSWQKPVIKEA